jgi:hypothetical protein
LANRSDPIAPPGQVRWRWNARMWKIRMIGALDSPHHAMVRSISIVGEP